MINSGSRARARKDMSSHKYEFEFRGKHRVGPRNFEESLVTPRAILSLTILKYKRRLFKARLK